MLRISCINSAKDSLKDAIVRVMSQMSQDFLIQAFRGFRSHREAVVEAEGGFN